jgi:hypothetical protein
MLTSEVEVLAAMIMKNTVFWKVTPFCLIEFYIRFERNAVRRVSQARNRQAGLFDLEDGGSKFLRNIGEFLPVCTALHSRI